MSDQITYNPGAVSDFASDVGSRAGQLHMIYEDTASKTNALQEFFAGHGAQGFFDARRRCCRGCRGSLRRWVSMGLPPATCWTTRSEPARPSRACSKAGRGPSEGGVHARTARLPHLLLAASWLR